MHRAALPPDRAERKTLLVAGAAAGMSATFAAPVAAVLLAVELLLFEWKPRSLVPVALAAATAAACRTLAARRSGRLFPVPPHRGLRRPAGPGRLRRRRRCSPARVRAAHGRRLRGRGRLRAPADPLDVVAGDRRRCGRRRRPARARRRWASATTRSAPSSPATSRARHALRHPDAVKALIWSVSLGSGTSGGVLAPLLMMGGALGGVEASVLPDLGAGFWPLDQHGRDAGRHDARAVHRHAVRRRAARTTSTCCCRC